MRINDIKTFDNDPFICVSKFDELLEEKNVTIQGNNFNTAYQLLKLDENGKIPISTEIQHIFDVNEFPNISNAIPQSIYFNKTTKELKIFNGSEFINTSLEIVSDLNLATNDTIATSNAVKIYIDNNYLPISGGTLTGNLIGTTAKFTTITGNLSGNATTANKTVGTLTIQGNGNNLDTFNGSSSKTINITPSSIGAATSSHIHTINQISNLENTLSNLNNSLSTLNIELDNKIDKVSGINNTILTADSDGNIIRNNAILSSSKTGTVLTTADVGIANGIVPLNSEKKIDWTYIQNLNLDTVKNVYSVSMANGIISSNDININDIGLQDEIVLSANSTGNPSYEKGTIFRRVAQTDNTINDYIQLLDVGGSANSTEIINGTENYKYISPSELKIASNVSNGYVKLTDLKYPALDGSLIINLSSTNLIGTISTTLIPNLPADKITTGKFAIARIPTQSTITNVSTTVPTTAAVFNALTAKANLIHTHDIATTTVNGFMSTDMVKKLNSIDSNAEENVIENISIGTGWTGSINISNHINNSR